MAHGGVDSVSSQIHPLEDWHLGKLPPEKNKDVGPFFYQLFDLCKTNRDRLGIPEKFLEHYRLFRNPRAHWDSRATIPKSERITLNFLFANIIRTVANLTASTPVAELESTDGLEDETDKILNQKMKTWNNEAENGISLNSSALTMEEYGITVEKHIWNNKKGKMETIIIDPMSWFPVPGFYEFINDMPHMHQAYPMEILAIHSHFNIPESVEIEPEETYSLLGEEREEQSIVTAGTTLNSINSATNYSTTVRPTDATEYKEKRALVIESWVRDTAQVKIPRLDKEGQPIFDEEGKPVEKEIDKYPGQIRVVHHCNSGNLVLNDQANPSINPAIPPDKARNSFLWDTFPYFKANSYVDTSSIWGFSIIEQVGDILLKIDELFSRIAGYIARVMLPTLVLPKTSMINRTDITNKAGEILCPPNAAAAEGLKYLMTPNLPSNFFDVLYAYIGFFDRISQIEDADRGKAPNKVIAKGAILALQERGAVLQRHKIRAIDYLVRNRGRCAISYFQNFHTELERMKVVDDEGNEEKVEFIGFQFAGRKFNYLVESGSTVFKTSSHMQELMLQLRQMGDIDREALLESLNIPNYKIIVERMAQEGLDAALELLIEAGLPEEDAIKLAQKLQEIQGGPGKRINKPPPPAKTVDIAK